MIKSHAPPSRQASDGGLALLIAGLRASGLMFFSGAFLFKVGVLSFGCLNPVVCM